jgi:sulfur carrier protein ThiS
MTITINSRPQLYVLPGDPITVREAREFLGLEPESYLVLREGVLLNENDLLQDGDVIKLIAAISGGARFA